MEERAEARSHKAGIDRDCCTSKHDMARCGISHEYPVRIVPRDDDGVAGPERVIGTAKTLGQAVALAEGPGYEVRAVEDGGSARFVADEGGMPYFGLTVYAG